MEHVLVNTQAVLTMRFSSDADDDVTVTITDPNGVDATPEDDVAASITNIIGGYSFTLTPLSELTRLTIRWTGEWSGVEQSIEDEVEIVGGVMFSVQQLREFGDGVLRDPKYLDAKLIAIRTGVTDFFEHECQTSFIPRYHRDVIYRPRHVQRHHLWLNKRRVQRLISVTVNETALDVSDIIVEPCGRLHRQRGWTNSGPIIVEYVYGYQQPPPKVVDAAMTLARHELVHGDISDRTVMLTNELGTIRLSTPGKNYPTGLPVVDSVLDRYDETAPMEP